MSHAEEEQRLLIDLSRPPGPLNLFGEGQVPLTLARLGEIGSPLGASWTVAELTSLPGPPTSGDGVARTDA